MKDILESSESFTAHATISAGYYMLMEMQKVLNKPKHKLIEAIDVATGYQDAQGIEMTKQTIVILEDIIEAKKVIEADCTKDESMLIEVKKMLAETEAEIANNKSTIKKISKKSKKK